MFLKSNVQKISAGRCMLFNVYMLTSLSCIAFYFPVKVSVDGNCWRIFITIYTLHLFLHGISPFATLFL